jgi:predicted Rossmann fold flavoprotein
VADPKSAEESYQLAVIGAGAAGFMAAITAAKRGKKVLLIDHSNKIAEKIRISGGGKCNFTNLNLSHENYISENPNFCRSAFASYGPEDFIAWIEEHGIQYHEKKLGQLFTDKGSGEIISLLVNESRKYGVNFLRGIDVWGLDKEEGFFELRLRNKNTGDLFKSFSSALVIATGGLSIPKLGASDFGYRIAKQFGHRIVEPRPGLVPLVFKNEIFKKNSGLSFYARVSLGSRISFDENILFTHKGLSGPAILQISSYLKEGETFLIDFCPFFKVYEFLIDRKKSSKKKLKNILLEMQYPTSFQEIYRVKLNRGNIFPEDFLSEFFAFHPALEKSIAELSDKELKMISEKINFWGLSTEGNEAYDKAEVTVGGVDTRDLNSKTMESRLVPDLYFIGEVVDLTGWLGGYNFQWAWSSGFVAGSSI